MGRHNFQPIRVSKQPAHDIIVYECTRCGKQIAFSIDAEHEKVSKIIFSKEDCDLRIIEQVINS